jgi:YjbE family integral membrane protein
MDLGFLGQVTFNWDFVVGFFSIIIINLILSGDNAVVIAMAVRSLPRKQRIQGIAFGSGVAVVLRVVLTFFAAQLLQIQFIKFVGGAVILWIAVQLFLEATPENEVKKEKKTIWQAIWIIIIADVTMSIDNVLAVAGASKGNLFLLLFGLGLSIPLVVFTSNLLSMLMDKYPFLIYLGAAILGRVGGEMMIGDPFIIKHLQPSTLLQYGVEAFCTVGVLIAGKAWVKWKISREERVPLPAVPVRPVTYAQKIETMAVVTISRERKNGCVEIGEAVARQLGYEFVDRNCIYSHLQAAGEKWGKMAKELDEERPTLWEKYDREYRGFIALIESIIYDYAAKGQAVILGRGSAFLLHDMPQVLKVRLYAPLEVRIERLMAAEKMDRITAQGIIEKTDKSRAGYVQAIYGKQLKDTENYDLIFNTAIQSYEQVTDNIVEVLKEWGQRATPESRDLVINRAIAARVKARLYTHPEIFIPRLKIFHDGSSIVLKGLVRDPKEFRFVEEIAREAAGDCPVKNALSYR